jgi:hypothetical protein
MAGFDSKKDKLVMKLGRFTNKSTGSKLVARVYRYDGGEPKFSIQRVGINKTGEEYHRSLGRLSLKEAKFVAP